MAKWHRAEAGGARQAEGVDEGQVAFAGAVELADLVDAEALLERLPDLRPQAVADHKPYPVVAVAGRDGTVEQVAAEFADVAEGGGAVTTAVVPKARGAELASQRQGAAAAQHRAPGHRQGVVVVHRQGAVQDVVRLEPHRHLAQAGHAAQPAVMRHHRGLGQAGGAGGEDIEAGLPGQHTARLQRVGGGLQAHAGVEVAVARRRLARAGPEIGALVLRLRMEGRGLQRFPAFGADHHQLGPGQVQAVAQRLAALVVVEHGRDRAQLHRRGDAGQHFRPVLHQDRHRVAGADAMGAEQPGMAVGPGVELGIAPAALVEQQGGALRIAFGDLLQQQADRAGAFRLGPHQVPQTLVDAHAVGQCPQHAARQVAQAHSIALAVHVSSLCRTLSGSIDCAANLLCRRHSGKGWPDSGDWRISRCRGGIGKRQDGCETY